MAQSARIWGWVAMFAAAGLGLCGCELGRIEGKVIDVRGEPLHGVAVSIEGSRRQDLTNSLGVYSVHFTPGPVVLLFSKTGYTPGRLEFQPLGRRLVEAAQVTLWPLPESKGVYLFENYRYIRTMPVEAQTYESGGQKVYGTTRWSEVLTDNPQPAIIFFKLPMPKAALVRIALNEVMVTLPDGRQSPAQVWTESEEIPTTLVPIDDPTGEGALIQIQPNLPLGEGSYAVHWGALHGDIATDPRMFIFSVVNAQPPATP